MTDQKALSSLSDHAGYKASYDYIPALDGFRGLCILTLMFSHGGLPNIFPGVLALLCFFVISSFLLTRQMIVEIEKSGTLNLKGFYLRRIFRLVPALLLFIAFFTPIMRALGCEITLTQIASVLFYFANFYHIYFGYPKGNPFPIVWSLSVEEHFYMIFPFIMLVFRRDLRKALPWFCGVFFAVLFWRLHVYHACLSDPSWKLCGLPGSPRWKGTDVMIDCLFYGSVIALLLHYHTEKMRRLLVNRTAFALSLAGIAISVALRDEAYRETYRFTLQSLCLSVMVINVLYGKWSLPRDLLSAKPIVFVGQLSYSLYLFHFGTLILVLTLQKNQDGLHGILSVLSYGVGAFLLATLSYYLVERPMIAVRKRFGSRRKDLVG